MKRIGLYLRVSTEEQARITDGSLVSQKARLEEYVAGLNRRDSGWGQIVDVYQDTLSAKDMNRPEFKRLIADVRSGRINLILATELSRLSRSTRDFCELWDIFKQYKTRFITLREQFDTTTAAGEMMVFNLINFAQFERKQTAERISANQLSRAKRGLWNGGTIPLGYTRNPKNPGQLIPNQDEAKDVETIFKTFLETGAVRKACQAVTKKGIFSKSYVNKHGIAKGGGAFTVPSLYQILTNKAYLGIREINKKKSTSKLEEVKAAWEPIVNRELFDLVQERLGANKNKYKPAEWKKYAYPLTEKIICGECGKNLGGKSANGQGGTYNYYAHARQLHSDGKSHLKRCQMEKVRAQRTEEMVIRSLRDVLSRPEKIDEMIQAYAKQSQEVIPGLEGKLKQVDIEIRTHGKRRENLMERIADLPPEINADLFFEKIKAVTKKLESADVIKADLMAQKNKATGQVIDREGLRRRLHNSLALLESSPKEKQREIFNNVIQFAEVYPMKMRLGLYAPTVSSTLTDQKLTGTDSYLRRCASSTSVRSGASEENRTPTPVKVLDFESSASTSSATEAIKKNLVSS